MDRQEELLIKKRFVDLSRLANRKGSVTFSNFLNLNELNLFHQSLSDIETSYQLFGGYKFAERQMIAFIPDALYYASDYAENVCDAECKFPIACLHFSPKQLKFSELLSHRDVLGALMNLGVEHSRIGDIKLEKEHYYIFCEDAIAEYLLDNLTQIRRTIVVGERSETCLDQLEQAYEQLDGIVASVRLDNIIAFATKKSRAQSAVLIQSQKVFINDRVVSSNAYECKENDVISIRGFGKFIYNGSKGETRKGRVKISLKKYS